MDNVTEEWRPIAGWEGLYQISSHGRIRSLARTVTTKNGQRKPVRERIMKPYHRDRYAKVLLSRDGEQTDALMHVLVAEAFLGPKPDGLEVNHKNRDTHDNRVANLEYITHAENLQHAHRSGHPIAKLTPDDVRAIRRRYAKGERIAHLAREHGVRWETINNVLRKRTWGYIE